MRLLTDTEMEMAQRLFAPDVAIEPESREDRVRRLCLESPEHVAGFILRLQDEVAELRTALTNLSYRVSV